MLEEFTRRRFKALELLFDYLKQPSRELKLDAIASNFN